MSDIQRAMALVEKTEELLRRSVAQSGQLLERIALMQVEAKHQQKLHAELVAAAGEVRRVNSILKRGDSVPFQEVEDAEDALSEALAKLESK